ncbi:hypothetical protein AMECASPLE_002912 [Ameca splendens]|uniref:Uncharacterized protein n=1 Tax=Ameca splendens TaxID=208324 RepID=A0ABV0Z873_9TELE
MTGQSDQSDSVAQLLMALTQQGILLGQRDSSLHSLHQQQTTTAHTLADIYRQITALDARLPPEITNPPVFTSAGFVPTAPMPTAATPSCLVEPFFRRTGNLQCALLFQ